MIEAEKTPALWRQLQETLYVLAAVREGKSGSAAMDLVPADMRGGVQALSFHAWRNMGRAQAIRTLIAKKTPPPMVDTLLCLALALVWEASQARYDEHTLVNQAVEATKRTRSISSFASFVNACLRRFLRERERMVIASSQRPEAKWNHPEWWISRLQIEHPLAWESILNCANRHPPMVLRVNARKITPTLYVQELQAAGIEVAMTSGTLVQLVTPVQVGVLPGFLEGLVSVQDGAAQMAANLLVGDFRDTMKPRVLDACAAPGGKTAHLLELHDLEVLALDVDPDRVKRVRQTLDRLNLVANVQCADAAKPEEWWDGRSFDYILLDAPCTASGIVRRHPDIRWLRREADIDKLAAEQRRLLAALWPLLKPGGKMLYCTCSVFRAEGIDQVKSFLENNKDAVLNPSPGHLLPNSSTSGQRVPDNVASDHDGFFYALFEKKHF